MARRARNPITYPAVLHQIANVSHEKEFVLELAPSERALGDKLRMDFYNFRRSLERHQDELKWRLMFERMQFITLRRVDLPNGGLRLLFTPSTAIYPDDLFARGSLGEKVADVTELQTGVPAAEIQRRAEASLELFKKMQAGEVDEHGQPVLKGPQGPSPFAASFRLLEAAAQATRERDEAAKPQPATAEPPAPQDSDSRLVFTPDGPKEERPPGIAYPGLAPHGTKND